MHQEHQLIILSPGFPADEEDSSCIPALQDFVLAWKNMYPKAAINIISFQYPRVSGKYLWNGIQVYAAGGSDKKGIIRLWVWWKVLICLLLLKKRKQAYLLTYFLTEAAYIGRIYARISGLPQIAIAAGQDVQAANKYLKGLSAGKLSIVVFNEKMNNTLLNSTGTTATAIITMGAKAVNASIGSRPSKTIDVLVVGSLISIKQVDLAILLIARLSNTFKFLKAEIVGAGKEMNNLQQLTKSINATAHISFTGHLHREAVFEKMNQAKILLHTSQYEGQSAVISEALQHGLYVVCFDVGRIMDHQKIIVCGQTEAMLSEMKKILSDPAPDYTPVDLPPISSTVLAYSRLFDQLRSSS